MPGKNIANIQIKFFRGLFIVVTWGTVKTSATSVFCCSDSVLQILACSCAMMKLGAYSTQFL